MGINSETLKLKEDIVNLINNSSLPPVNISLILECVIAQVNGFLNSSIIHENSQKDGEKRDGDQSIDNN